MKYILSLLLIVNSIFSFGQINITDPDNDQSDPLDCAVFDNFTDANFFDDGGGASSYSANFNDTITVCPDLIGGIKLSVNFGTNGNLSWDVDATDTMYVFDGPDVNSPLLGAYNSATNPGGVNLTASFENNPSGCLTFVFVSDGNTEGSGWEANIQCLNPPQPIDPHIEAYINGAGGDALDPADTGYVDLCPGDSVLLVANPELQYSFENNGYGYSQDVDDLTYEWNFSDGTQGPNNDSIWFTPPSADGFLVELSITDDYPQTDFMICKVRVSKTPTFAGVGPIEDTVCFNQEATLLGGTSAQDSVGVDFPGGAFQFGGIVSGFTPLPDGDGDLYTTTIPMSGFSPGSTFSSPTDLQDICVTMEHSFLGDLEMWIECPNGTTVTLFDSYDLGPGLIGGNGFGGGGTFLGEPVDDVSGTPGNGYEYCFSEVNNTWSDFATEHAAGNFVTLTSPPAPDAGDAMNPGGVYLPEGSYSDLIGCPLNGSWTLNIVDNWSLDDGYIFEWGLTFDPVLFENNETYQNTATDAFWSPDPTITSPLSGDTMITVMPDSVGDAYYTFNIENDFGCQFDTTVMIHVLDTIATVNSLDTTVLCATDSVPLWTTASGLEPFTYTWSNGDVGDTIIVPAFDDGTTEYYVTITDACGVETIDTASVTLNQTLAIDTMIQFPSECGEATGAVSGQGSGFTGTPDYDWSGPGADNPNNINATVWEDLSSGWYYFTIEDDVCSVMDSIFLEQDPPPTAAFTANPPVGYAPLGVEFVNNSDAADTYDWDFGNGDGVVVTDLSNQNTTYNTEGVYTVTLTVTEGSCTDQTTQNVIVELLLPLSYDMPNVFTPNNDGSNDVFTLNTENAADLELVILNRWGNVVYESNGDVDAVWNGKVQNSGQECQDGTYFYKFTIRGVQNEEFEEHGFVQLVRDTSDK